jgi:lipopolysaccharide export system protein LptA
MIVSRKIAAGLLFAALAFAGGSASDAQPAAKGPPNALQGFSQNRDQPVHIEAASLEVRDKDKVATFAGDVRVEQGDTHMRCKSLIVFYEQDAVTGKEAGKNDGKNDGKPMVSATPGPGGSQQIKRLEAHGGVVVTQKEQTATGDQGIFDMKSNTVTLTGNVVMTQGKNVLRGERLTVNLVSGVSRVDGSGRVQMLVQPGSAGAIEPGAAIGNPITRPTGHPANPAANPPSSPKRSSVREPAAPLSLQPGN